MAAWFRPTLSADEQARVLADRDEHPDPVVRRKMLVLWAVHLGHPRQQAAGRWPAGRTARPVLSDGPRPAARCGGAAHSFSEQRGDRMGTHIRVPVAMSVVAVLVLTAGRCQAGLPGKVAQEVAEGVMRRFGAKAVGEGVEALARRIGRLAERFGDDAVAAVRHAGPRALRAADEAGEHAGVALRAIARHGDDGVAFVAARPRALALVARHGDDGAAALVKHRGLAEGLMESGGEPAVRALSPVGPQAGRRLIDLDKNARLTLFLHIRDRVKAEF
jgi:hypothetical protein